MSEVHIHEPPLTACISAFVAEKNEAYVNFDQKFHGCKVGYAHPLATKGLAQLIARRGIRLMVATVIRVVKTRQEGSRLAILEIEGPPLQ